MLAAVDLTLIEIVAFYILNNLQQKYIIYVHNFFMSVCVCMWFSKPLMYFHVHVPPLSF